MKRKTCKSPNCISPVWARGNCLNCDKKQFPHKYEIKRSNKGSTLSSSKSEKGSKKPVCTPKKQRPIAKISETQKRRLTKYRIRRDKYMKYQTCCEKCGSTKALQLHHLRGRVGNLLYDTRYFCVLCEICHNFTHNNPEISYKEGWLIKRLDKFEG